jgi:pimeloyl-ACP methyl ester carboxylesterase
VLRHLRAAHGQTRFVVYGSCFDARTALSAFADEADAIAALVFVAAPVMELDTLVRADADRKSWRHLVRALRNPENWRALSRGERWSYMATVLSRVTRRTLGGARAPAHPLAESFRRHFDALVRSRARALFLYGADDVEYHSFRIAEREAFDRLPPEARARFDVVVWPGEVHGFLEMTRQRETFEAALAWMAALHPATSTRATGVGTPRD